MTMHAWLLRIVCVALAFALSACVAIPLSTMWKLHDMTAERFLANDPKQLRVGIRVDDAMKRGPASPQIRIDIDAPSTKPICYPFALDAVDANSAGEPALEVASSHRRWYAFALSQRGMDAFERARREVRVNDLSDADFEFKVTMNEVLALPENASSIPIRIDVALNRKDGYFTMIKETNVTMSHDKNPSPAKPSSPTIEASAKPVCEPAA